MFGNLAIIGADGDEKYSGAAYVFERNDLTGQWKQTAKLIASDGAADDQFGFAVSVSQNVGIIGAPFDEDNGDYSGAAYVFERDDLTGQWNQTAKLLASDGAANDEFGWTVSVSGKVAIAGASYDDDKGPDSGSAYVYERDDLTGQWNETAKLTASDGEAHDEFGIGVSVSGYTAIVGAYNDDDNGGRSGSAYVFEKNTTTGNWTEVDKLIASDGAENDLFGVSVSVFGNVAIVGAFHDEDKGFRSGSAYVFERDDLTGRWYETFKLTALDGEANDQFGSSVSVSGNVAIVGAQTDANNGDRSGSAYVFERDDLTGHWHQIAKLIASDGAADDYFGYSVSVSGSAAFVGAYNDNDKGQRSGSAYVFDIVLKSP